MPSEYVIYMSAFILGILTLAAFSATYRNLDDQANQIIADQTLQSLIQDIAGKIQSLYQQIYYLISNYGNTSTFSTSLAVSLPHKVQNNYYRITAVLDGGTNEPNTIKLLGYYEADLTNPVTSYNALVNAKTTTINGSLISLDNIHEISLTYDGAGNFALTFTSTE